VGFDYELKTKGKMKVKKGKYTVSVSVQFSGDQTPQGSCSDLTSGSKSSTIHVK